MYIFIGTQIEKPCSVFFSIPPYVNMFAKE